MFRTFHPSLTCVRSPRPPCRRHRKCINRSNPMQQQHHQTISLARQGICVKMKWHDGRWRNRSALLGSAQIGDANASKADEAAALALTWLHGHLGAFWPLSALQRRLREAGRRTGQQRRPRRPGAWRFRFRPHPAGWLGWSSPSSAAAGARTAAPASSAVLFRLMTTVFSLVGCAKIK